MKPIYYSAGYVGTQSGRWEASTQSFVAAVICPDCWQIQSVSWDTDVDVGFPEKAHKKIKTCPVCGKKLQLKKDYFAMTKRTANNAAVTMLKQQMEQSQEAPIRKQINSLVSKAFTGKDMPEDNGPAMIATGSTTVLKQYLQNVLQAESAVYFMVERIVNIRKMQSQKARESVFEAAKNEKKIEDQKKSAKRAANKAEKERQAAVLELEEKIKQIRADFEAYDFSADVERKTILHPHRASGPAIIIPPKPREPEYKKPNFFNKKKVLEENARLEAAYARSVEEYQAALNQQKVENERIEAQYREDLQAYYVLREEEQRRVEEETEKLKKKARLAAERKIQRLEKKIQAVNETALAAKTADEQTEMAVSVNNVVDAFLSHELAEAEKQLKQVAKARGKLYAYNILHSKYRNHVAVATFLEYLETGRCTELQGANGAYNLYESECRSNLIISQLNTIVSQLEQIKQNQYLMYRELTQINVNLRSLNNSMDHVIEQLGQMQCSMDDMSQYLGEISYHTERMDHSTAKIAFNTRKLVDTTAVIADNTGKIAKNTSKIAENTAISAHFNAITAHYAKVNAELTDALGFMIALK